MNEPMPYVPPKIWVWDEENGGPFASTNRPVAGAEYDAWQIRIKNGDQFPAASSAAVWKTQSSCMKLISASMSWWFQAPPSRRGWRS